MSMATETDPLQSLNQPRALIPSFTQPTPPPATTEPDNPPPPSFQLAPAARPRRVVDDEQSRTGTSSAGSKPTQTEVAGLVVGLLGLLVSGIAFLVQLRAGRGVIMRRPTRDESRDIAAPLARIALRHADLSLLGPTVADVIAAGGATGAYLTNGPLLGYDGSVDDGVPPNLQEDEEF